ncbi:MAG: GDSL-type esterase/lipase family protein [bacterium]
MNLISGSKKILCFGDSNTWGYIPNTDTKSIYQRYSAEIRYPGVLQKLLGEKYEVIEDGVNSRTISVEDRRPGKSSRTAISYLPQLFYANDPLDYLIIMIGSNDLKTQFALSPAEVAEQIITLLQTAKSLASQIDQAKPKLLYIVPPPINDAIPYAKNRFENGLQRYQEMIKILKALLIINEIDFIDCFSLVDLGSDGLHLTEAGHKKLGEAIFRKLFS